MPLVGFLASYFSLALAWPESEYEPSSGSSRERTLVLVCLDELASFLTQAIGQVLALFLLLEIGILVGTM